MEPNNSDKKNVEWVELTKFGQINDLKHPFPFE